MNKFFFIVASFLVTIMNPVSAQVENSNIKVHKSKLGKINPFTKLPITQVRSLGTDNGLMYAYIPPFYEGTGAIAPANKYQKQYIATFSNNLEVTNYKELVFDEYQYFQKMVWLNNSIYTFSSRDSKDYQESTLCVNRLSKKSLDFEDSEITLLKLKAKEDEKIESIRYNINFSPDSSKLLITYQLIGKKDYILSHGISVFDTNFSKLWSKNNFELNLGYGNYVFNSYKVDNLGNVYANINVYESKENLHDGRYTKPGFRIRIGFNPKQMKISPNNTSFITCISNNGKAINTHKLSFGDKKVRHTAFEPNNGMLVCVGLYSEKNKTSIIGTCYMEIQPGNSQMLTNKGYDYDLGFILDGLGEKTKAKVEKSYKNGEEFETGTYNLDIKFREGGGFWFLAEHQDIIKEGFNGGPQGTIWIDCHYYNNIGVFNFDMEGHLISRDKINKLAFTNFEKSKYGSYNTFVNNDTLFVFYNKIERRKSAMWKYKTGTFNVVKYDKQGNGDSSTLSSVSEDKVIVQPTNIGEFSNNSLFFFGQETLKFRFFKIAIE